jgi:hypothetical protein
MWSPPWLIVLAAASLGACQGLSQQGPRADAGSERPAPSWRVVERVGESRYLSPSMSGWEQVVAGSIVPASSQISTGIGGRLILTQASNQLSAGTSSRFILPGSEPGGSVRQTAGWLRYRIETAQSGTFGIETPFLDLLLDDAVVDVTVADSETEVAVVSGRVHVKTLDDRHQIDLHAGYIGYAGLEGSQLALRRGLGLALEPVPATVIPALHPRRPGPAMPDPTASRGAAAQGIPADLTIAEASRARMQGAASGIGADLPRPSAIAAPTPGQAAAGPPGTVPPPTPQRTAPATLLAMASLPADLGNPAMAAPRGASAGPVVAAAATVTMVLPASKAATVALPAAMPVPIDGAGPDLMGDGMPASSAPAAEPAAPPAAMPIAEPADQVRHRFDLLTEGLLDGLPPAPAAMPGSRR